MKPSVFVRYQDSHRADEERRGIPPLRNLGSAATSPALVGSHFGASRTHTAVNPLLFSRSSHLWENILFINGRHRGVQ